MKWNIEIDTPIYNSIKHYADTCHGGAVEDAVSFIIRKHMENEGLATHKEHCGCVYKTNEGLEMLDYDSDLPLDSTI